MKDEFDSRTGYTWRVVLRYGACGFKIIFQERATAYPKAATAVDDALRQGSRVVKSRKTRNIKVKNKRIFKTMANHKSSKKRIRQTATKRAHNRLYHKTARNAVKALRNTTERSAAEALLPKVSSMLDKLAKTNIIHKNKAANLKSSLTKLVNTL